MKLSRRQFWKLAASGVVGAAVTANVDIERLLWVPGEKTYFLPAEKVFTGKLISPEWMTKEIARLLKRNLQFAQQITRQHDADYAMQLGGTVNVRVPARFTVSDNRRYVPQPIIDNTKAVTLNKQYAVTLATLDPSMDVELARAHCKQIAGQLADRIIDDRVDVFAPLVLPTAVESAHRVTDRATGLSVRGVRDYDINTDSYFTRFDVLGGSTHGKG